MQIFHDLFSVVLLCCCNWWKLWEDQPDSSTSWSVIVRFIVIVCDIGTRNFTAVRALEVSTKLSGIKKAWSNSSTGLCGNTVSFSKA